jgi:hypothetical protein
MKSSQEIKSEASANLKLKIFKQTDLYFIFQPQKPKVQSSFWNHRKLKNDEASASDGTLYLSELCYELLDPLGQF